MRHIVVLSLALACLAGPGQAEAPAGLITKPDWAALPSAGDIARLIPPAAERGVNGAVMLECSVTAEGRLEACAIVSESPADKGFGKAALAMAGKFRMKPKTLDGLPVAGALVRVPINFAGDGSDLPPADLPQATGRFVYAGAAPDVRGTNGQSAKAAYYVDLKDRTSERSSTSSELVLVLDHPLLSANDNQSYVVLFQTFDCKKPQVGAPAMQFFNEAGQRTGVVLGMSNLVPMRPQFKLDQARSLACGLAQPDATILGSITEVRADAKVRFAAGTVK